MSSCWDRSTAGASTVVADNSMLQRALRYVGLFAANNSVHPHFSVIEIRDGHCIGGDEEAVACFSCWALRDLKLHIAVRDAPVLCRVLHCMSGYVSLTETNTHYLFATAAIQCAIKKPQAHFPTRAESLFHNPIKAAVQTAASDALNKLFAMSIAQYAYDYAHPLKLSLDAESGKIRFFCWSADLTSNASCEAYPTTDHPFEAFDVNVDCLGLRTAAARAAPGSNIEIAVVKNTALKVTDRRDDFTTEVLFALRPR